MYICLFEDSDVSDLYPLTRTRPVFDLRTGRRTLRERTRDVFGTREVLLHARPSVADLVASRQGGLVNRIPEGIDVLFINGSTCWFPGDAVNTILETTRRSRDQQLFVSANRVVGAWIPNADPKLVERDALTQEDFGVDRQVDVGDIASVTRLWHLTQMIEDSILHDFRQVSHGFRVFERPGATVDSSVVMVESERIYLAPGVVVKPGAILSAEDGPIIVDDGAVIMEQSVVKGPAYIGPRCQVKVGANLANVVIGPVCKVGGEVHDSILHGFSNKAHDGFLGDSYLGSWCNLGAGTNNSNLKNDYGTIKMFNVGRGQTEDSGEQFVGLFMGDHSKCGIGTTFNTGTIVGVCCNLFDSGLHARYVPSFSWGRPNHYEPYRVEKALNVARAAMARRDETLSAEEEALLRALSEMPVMRDE